jgi:hypothetical protein
MNIIAFWDISPGSLVEVDRYFNSLYMNETKLKLDTKGRKNALRFTDCHRKSHLHLKTTVLIYEESKPKTQCCNLYIYI